ncbi:neurogenic protein big brain [Anastrepha obliqua]|uniref:neurogenic protein big brain n=1 Tax=Anastrepha obliqua TaxID=95512 RepID=UPI00240A8772|nr:neurogenic protein big brain [Anastrepha obliqua]
MTDESLHTIPLEHNIDYHIMSLFERLEAMRKDSHGHAINNRLSSTQQQKRKMQGEIRTLEFWRSIISECLASFFYVFIVCGAAAGAGVGASVSSVLLATALASGLAMATLTQCFIHISGAHVNPAVTLAACIIRAISPVRAAMYITAQCGGGIAGAALLYGVTVPGYQGNLQAAISHSASLAAWERFGVEFSMTFVVVLTYFVSTDSMKRYMGNSAVSVGAAYSACSFVSMPYLNPARSLGPSFVLNKWDNHWVYWFGPLVGGIASGLLFEYVFSSRRNTRAHKSSVDNDSSSIHSEDDLNFDVDVEKSHAPAKYSQGTYPRGQTNTKSAIASNTGTLSSGANYCQNLYTAPPLTKFDQPEPLYGGTRSLYCRSPTLTRTNLNRSQSVYTKSNTAINREIVPRPGPLVPAQSLYGMRMTQTQTQAQSSHLQNQNVQNQLQQRSESIYGIRGSTRQSHQQQQQHQHQSQQQQQHQHQHHQQQQQQPHQQLHQHQSAQQPSHHQSQPPSQDSQQGFQPVYGTRHNPNPLDGNIKYDRRPESAYGMAVHRNRGQSAQSDDSSYGSYHGSAVTPPARNQNGGEPILMYAPPPPIPSNHSQVGAPPMRTQSERKVTAPVVVSQSSQITTGVVTYATNSGQGVPPPPQQTTQQQPQQQPPPQQQQQQHQQQSQQQHILVQQHQTSQQQHYGMLPMRTN